MTNTAFEKRVLKLIRKLQKILCLDIHNITFKKAPEDDDNEFSMDCSPRYPYLGATIRYNTKALNQPEDIEELVVHELTHILTAPLEAKANKRHATESEIDQEEERLVDTFTNILLRLEGKK